MVFKRHLGVVLTIWACGVFAAQVPAPVAKSSPELQPILKILALPEDKIDLARARLTIEKILDPEIDVAANLAQIDSMVRAIKKTPRYSDTVEGKLNGIIQYLYQPGAWNDQKPYHYDFDDPLGTAKPENSRISHYLKQRTGNCVSMPVLVLVLAERLGMDVRLSTAPLHYFVRLKDQGQFYNVEATAGGLKADASYVREFLISPDALKNGIYLQNLNRKQAIALMLSDVAQYYLDDNQFKRSFEVTELMLAHYPKAVSAMLIRGSTWNKILLRDLDATKKKGIKNPTPEMHQHFQALLDRNLKWFNKAEALGWREPPKDYDKRYLKMVKEARIHYE